jgi:NAD(P)-dependent dehydrogenase (short-subunit alcohol dehydrogenase family)
MQIQDIVLADPWRVGQAHAPVQVAEGGGAIVNVLSALPCLNLPGGASCSISKAAAWGMTHALQTLRALAAGHEDELAGATRRAVKRRLSAESGIYLQPAA